MPQSHPILHCQGRHQVQGPLQEVTWNDGTSVTLYPVQVAHAHGVAVPSPYLRASRTPDGGWTIFSLLELCPQIEPELTALCARDVASVVHHALRHTFSNAPAMMLAAKQANAHKGAA